MFATVVWHRGGLQGCATTLFLSAEGFFESVWAQGGHNKLLFSCDVAMRSVLCHILFHWDSYAVGM